MKIYMTKSAKLMLSSMLFVKSLSPGNKRETWMSIKTINWEQKQLQSLADRDQVLLVLDLGY
jgi:hypothetical protein